MIDYNQIKGKMSSLLFREIANYIHENELEDTLNYHKQVLKNTIRGDHVDITEKVDHLARDLIADSIAELVENQKIKNELLAYFKKQKPYPRLYNGGISVFDKNIGKKNRKNLASKLYDELEQEYFKKIGADFLDRRIQNGTHLVSSTLQTLRDE